MRSFLTLGAASAWMVVGRGSGLIWTLLLISSLGIEDYGVYAGSYALAAILSAPIENIFVVRCVRVGDDEFVAERSLRTRLGVLLVAFGAAAYAFSFFVGFALIVAGSEMVFNAYKSSRLRDGRPAAIMRIDAIRQVASIAIASTYLLVAREDATLSLTCLCYLAPYIAVFALALPLAAPRASQIRAWRGDIVLMIDALVLSVYLQGDILLLGMIAGDDVVGLYSFASQVALAASTVGQLYGQQFAASLRHARGHTSAGASLKATLLLGLCISVGVVVVAVVAHLTPGYDKFFVVLLMMAPFAGIRTITNVWVTALHVKATDRPRIVWSAVALGARILVLLGLVVCGVSGAIAAALAATIGEVILAIFFARLMGFSVTGKGERDAAA